MAEYQANCRPAREIVWISRRCRRFCRFAAAVMIPSAFAASPRSHRSSRSFNATWSPGPSVIARLGALLVSLRCGLRRGGAILDNCDPGDGPVQVYSNRSHLVLLSKLFARGCRQRNEDDRNGFALAAQSVPSLGGHVLTRPHRSRYRSACRWLILRTPRAQPLNRRTRPDTEPAAPETGYLLLTRLSRVVLNGRFRRSTCQQGNPQPSRLQ